MCVYNVVMAIAPWTAPCGTYWALPQFWFDLEFSEILERGKKNLCFGGDRTGMTWAIKAHMPPPSSSVAGPRASWSPLPTEPPRAQTWLCVQALLQGSCDSTDTLHTKPCVQRPVLVFLRVSELLCSGWGPRVTPVRVSQNSPFPPHSPGKDPGFSYTQTRPAPVSVCMWHCVLHVLYPLSVPVIWPDSLKPMKVLVKCCRPHLLGKHGN